MIANVTNPGDFSLRPELLAVNLIMAVAIAVLLLVKFGLTASLNVNWDEFLFASRVYAFERGEIGSPLQTFYVHFFGWIKSVGGTGVDQIIAARQSMFGLRVLTCVCVFAIGYRLFGTTAALASVIAALGPSYMLAHGESFRADPIVATCIIVAATLLILCPNRIVAALLAGTCASVAMMMSIKTSIYAPMIFCLLIIALVFTDDRQRAIRAALVFCVGSMAALGALYLWHASNLAAAPSVSLVTKLTHSGEKFFAAPVPGIFQQTYEWDFAWWALVGAGAIAALFGLSSGDRPKRRAAAVVLALLLPLTTLTFYRNSFPYYYVCLIPFAALAVGYLSSSLLKAIGDHPIEKATIVVSVALALCWRSAQWVSLNGADSVSAQRQVLEAVKQLFPDPVPYIDRCSMVIDYPKRGIFMSTLNMGTYLERGQPMMQALVEQNQPLFVLENSSGLYLERGVERLARSPYRLLPEDHIYLQERYIPHWGPIRVAGRRFELSNGDVVAFDVPVAGPYTIESQAAVVVDGEVQDPGEVIALQAGVHEIQSAGKATSVTLRYGNHLPIPSMEAPARNIFAGLGFRTRP